MKNELENITKGIKTYNLGINVCHSLSPQNKTDTEKNVQIYYLRVKFQDGKKLKKKGTMQRRKEKQSYRGLR